MRSGCALQVLGSRGFRLTVFGLDGSLVDVFQHTGEARPRAMYLTPDGGTVWLRYSRPVSQEVYANSQYRFRVLDAEGVYVGDTMWPRIQGEGKVVGGHLLAMVFHEETLQLVSTVFRIVPAVAHLTY